MDSFKLDLSSLPNFQNLDIKFGLFLKILLETIIRSIFYFVTLVVLSYILSFLGLCLTLKVNRLCFDNPFLLPGIFSLFYFVYSFLRNITIFWTKIEKN